jgi:hypothetical protein
VGFQEVACRDVWRVEKSPIFGVQLFEPGSCKATSKPYASPIHELEMSAQDVHKEVGFGIERLFQLFPPLIPSAIIK